MKKKRNIKEPEEESPRIKFAIGAVVIILVLFYFVSISFQTCATAECFLEKANACETTSFEVQEEFGLMLYSTENCIFEKKVLNIDASEDPELKNLIEGKSLTCDYEKAMFKNKWMESLIADLDSCQGELKDIMQQLIVFG